MNILKKTYKYGFTLVELLIVITIIAILSSISFKAISIVNQKSAIARTTRSLMTLSSCLAEYQSEWGQYPAAERTVFTNWNPTANEEIQKKIDATQKDPGKEDVGKHATDNLLYYMIYKLDEDYWNSHKAAAGIYTADYIFSESGSEVGDWELPAAVTTVKDAWDREFVYKSKAPYKSYTLYSTGAKTDIAADDIYANETY